MRLKRLAKRILTLLFHPCVFVLLSIKGARDFYIAPQMTINSTKYLHLGTGLSLGRNSRFLFVSNYHGEQYSPSVSIGCNCTIGQRFSCLSAAPIYIKDNCLIASDVLVTSENHGMDVEGYDSYGATKLQAKPVEIGEGCWIGEKACIMPGVTLGRRCVVAAGAVVTKSFPPYSLVGGVPAKVIKTYNFDAHCWEIV